MPERPQQPKIYHITHVENLPAIVAAGGLLAEAPILARGGPAATIGMSGIKRRRLSLPVKCHPGDCVGDYVPFYFCPRSIMLYVIHRANHPELTYRGGQGPIVHLEGDLREVVDWAGKQGRRWAFTLSNAGAAYAEFRARLDELDQINWAAVAANDFRTPEIKEGKQAEFLVHGFFPWTLIRRIGVLSSGVMVKVGDVLAASNHKPKIEVIPSWYY